MSTAPKGGWIHAGARIVRVLLSDPKVRRDIETVTRHVQPDEAPELVKTLLWTDPGTTAAVAAMMPDVLNALIEATHALGRQAGRVPPALLRAATARALSRIRFRRLGMATGQGMAALIAGMRAAAAGANSTADAAADVRSGDPEGGDAWTQWTSGAAEALRDAGIAPADALEIPLEAVVAHLERAARDHAKQLESAKRIIRRVMRRHPDLLAALRSAVIEEEG